MLLARPHEGAVVVPSKRSIFVSKPNTLNPEQAAFWDRLRRILIERGLAPRTLGETDYPNSAPIAAVRRVLEDCDGAMILGMAQLSVSEGVLKANSPNESNAADSLWPTAWNHIEAGMAFMLDLPMLIIRERGVAGGVFDVGNTDRFVHQADLSLGWLESERFLQPFNEWLDEIGVGASERPVLLARLPTGSKRWDEPDSTQGTQNWRQGSVRGSVLSKSQRT
jgi:hypothetical protein